MNNKFSKLLSKLNNFADKDLYYSVYDISQTKRGERLPKSHPDSRHHTYDEALAAAIKLDKSITRPGRGPSYRIGAEVVYDPDGLAFYREQARERELSDDQVRLKRDRKNHKSATVINGNIKEIPGNE